MSDQSYESQPLSVFKQNFSLFYNVGPLWGSNTVFQTAKLSSGHRRTHDKDNLHLP